MWPWCLGVQGQVGKEPLEGFEGFEAWQTAGLNASDKLLMSAWRQRKSCWCLEGFGGFEAWQMAGLNASSKLLVSLWRPRKAVDVALVRWLAGSGVPKKLLEGFGRFEAWQTASNASKKLPTWPWCLGVQGQGRQSSLWRVLEGLKPGKQQAWTPATSYWGRVEGAKNKRHAWAPCDERAKFHTSGGPTRRPGVRRIFRLKVLFL